jgi:hypothetical protein
MLLDDHGFVMQKELGWGEVEIRDKEPFITLYNVMRNMQLTRFPSRGVF